MIKVIAIAIAVIAFIAILFIGTDALMCEPPCV